MRHRCQIAIYKRDTYRRTGRGPSGFSVHYIKGQCSRAAVIDGMCRQHLNCSSSLYAERLNWHTFVKPVQRAVKRRM